MKRIAYIFTFMILMLPAFALNEQKAEEIRANPGLLYGEGYGKTQREADQQALTDLISKISVNVSSNTGMRIETSSINGEMSEAAAMEMVIDTYASAHLANTESLIISQAPNAHVMRYISRQEIADMFEQRTENALLYVNQAHRALEAGKVGTALRCYYWALTLVKSLQYPDKATCTNAAGEKRQMSMWLPMQINEIMDDIEVRVTEHSVTDATLFFTYNGNPVRELDFTFYNGNSWTPLNSAKNGIATIELRPGVEVNNLKIRYEYEYVSQSGMDPAVQGLLSVFQPVHLDRCETALAADASTWKDAVSKEAMKQQLATIKEAKTNTLDEVDGRKPYQKTIEQIISGVTKGKMVELKPLFTDGGWMMMEKLLGFGRAKMLSKQEYGFYDLGDDRVVCRSLVMTFAFPNNNRTFTEDVTFTFDADKKIEAVSFGLGAEANEHIFNRAIASDGTKIWSDASVMALTTFLENYKTAFALKELNYLEGVFDDNAVIITGTVLKRPEATQDGKKYVNDMVQYNKYTKEQYMDKLKRTFASQEFVNLRFTDNDVTMMGSGGELFSIQIHQDYYSSTYCDTGYLFLIVDINDPDRPLIKVRTWQPERDPSINGNYPHNHPDWGLIGPGNF